MNMSDIALNSKQHQSIARQIHAQTKEWDHSCGCEYGQHQCPTIKTMNGRIDHLRTVGLDVAKKLWGREAYGKNLYPFYDRPNAFLGWLNERIFVRIEHFDNDYILIYHGSAYKPIQDTPNPMAFRTIAPRSLLSASDRDFASALRPWIHAEKAHSRWSDLLFSEKEIERLQDRLNYLRKSQRDIDSIIRSSEACWLTPQTSE